MWCASRSASRKRRHYRRFRTGAGGGLSTKSARQNNLARAPTNRPRHHPAKAKPYMGSQQTETPAIFRSQLAIRLAGTTEREAGASTRSLKAAKIWPSLGAHLKMVLRMETRFFHMTTAGSTPETGIYDDPPPHSASDFGLPAAFGASSQLQPALCEGSIARLPSASTTRAAAIDPAAAGRWAKQLGLLTQRRRQSRLRSAL